MKIRNGFVSNSSSSSFILVYDKSGVIDNLNEIVDYVKANPNTYPIFFGDELNEGNDTFILTPEQEALIRKFPDRFITQNKNKNIALYTNDAKMIKDYTEYGNEEPDMSDVEHPALTNDELSIYLSNIHQDKTLIPKEILEKLDKLDNYEKIHVKRIDELVKKKNKENIRDIKEKIIKETNCSKENLESKEFYLDNGAVEETIDFAERYLTEEWYTTDSDYILESRCGYNRPYLLEYDELITDKEQILEYLSKTEDLSSSLIFWSNSVFNFVEHYEEGFTVGFYRIGKIELEILNQFLKDSTKEVYLATNANIIMNDSGKLSKSFKYKLGYGNPIIVDAGSDIANFKSML